MLIFALFGLGIIAGLCAHLIVGRGSKPDWGRLLLVGWAGSFIGGLIGSLIAGDGIQLRISGIIGSIVGATILLAIIGDKPRAASR